MKTKYKFLFITLLFSLRLLSQNSTIYVTYKQATNNKRFTKFGEVKDLNIEYQLVANKTISEFKLIEKLDSDANYVNNRFKFKGIHYKNLKTEEKLHAYDFFGNSYIIRKPYVYYKWKLTKSTKIIGGYTCYKAVATVVEKANNTDNGRVMKYDVIAWYTPTISYPYGPNSFDGLPGLILEVYWNNNFLIAKQISIKKNEEVEIKRPVYGKKITEVEFNNYIRELFRENKRRN